MKTEFLEYFLEVERCRSFSKDADNLYISQSSLSKSIMALEVELGGKLLVRDQKGVTLTAYGESLKGYISNIIEDYQQLNQAVRNHRLTKLKTIRVAALLNFAYSKSLSKFIQFEQQHRDTFIESQECNHDRLYQLLDSNKVDVCVGYRQFLGDNRNYETCIFPDDPIVFVTGRAHADAIQWSETVSFADIKKEWFCFPREDMRLFSFFVSSFHSAGFYPEMTLSDVRLSSISRYVARGLRSTLQMKGTAEKFFSSVEFRIIALEDAPVLTPAVYIHNSEDDPEKKILLRDLKDSFYIS